MIVISDTTPLIGLATIGRFDFLQRLFSQIIIPSAVYDEAVTHGRDVGGARREVSAAHWIKTVTVQDRLAVSVLLDELDLGEAETIVLGQELGADWILMDEKKGRRKLTQLDLRKIGTVGILLKAKQLGWISTLQPELEHLRLKGFSLSQSVFEAVLQQAEESP